MFAINVFTPMLSVFYRIMAIFSLTFCVVIFLSDTSAGWDYCFINNNA